MRLMLPLAEVPEVGMAGHINAPREGRGGFSVALWAGAAGMRCGDRAVVCGGGVVACNGAGAGPAGVVCAAKGVAMARVKVGGDRDDAMGGKG